MAANLSLFYFSFLVATDGELLVGLPKVKVLRNDRREGTIQFLVARENF